jgi:EAL domain-containing protein (putative c-di-GMP-specific phosphodiesterase class I)/GGDEF domain-containing protein
MRFTARSNPDVKISRFRRQQLNDTTAVPLIVHSATREAVEALNGLLRRSGIAAHCTWIPSAQDIPDALEQINPELLICYLGAGDELQAVTSRRDQISSMVPLIVVREQVDERLIAEDMAQGARDTVSLQQPGRLQAVIKRELHAFRIERTLNSTLRAAQDYRSQLEVVLQRSNDAIAQVQEGILVNANAAWLELFGFVEATGLTGQPVMDLFEEATHAPLKGALTACLQGRWDNHPLKAGAVLGDGSVVPLELMLAVGEYEGDPSVRLIVPARRRDDRQLADELELAVQSDPGTGLLTRRPLLSALQERLERAVAGGVRYLVCVRPDKFAHIERDLGILASEQLLIGFANTVRSLLGPNDIAGHFGGTTLMLLLERGNGRDVEAWNENLVERVARHAFLVDGQAVHVTCTAGMSVIPTASPDLNACAMEALEGVRRGRARGGNQMVSIDRADNDTRVQAYDQVWVKHIKAALMENRFRLVQQPIAALGGGERKIYDMAIRMLDTQGKEVLPSDFLPAAARNDLLKNIDRWVIGASLSFVAKRKPDLAFVRLSRDSALDPALPQWLEMQLKSTLAQPSRLCLQVTEEVALRHPQQTLALANSVRSRGMRFALEHFGASSEWRDLMQNLPLDFVKIDGSLMQGLNGSVELQQKVKELAEAAAKKNIQTVAERIEDANTMAVVWQLGVQYIQGYFVHSPEEVVLKS